MVGLELLYSAILTHSKKGRFLPLVEYLSKFYPKEHKVQLLLAPSFEKDKPKIIKTKLCALDNQHKKDLSGMSLFIPALGYHSDHQVDEHFRRNTEDLKYLKKIAVTKKTGG